VGNKVEDILGHEWYQAYLKNKEREIREDWRHILGIKLECPKTAF